MTLFNNKKNESAITLATFYVSGKRSDVTDKDYEQYRRDKNRHAIAKIIFERLYGRYIKPFTFENPKYRDEYKNGFSIMANCCLCIETIQSFKNGWETTKEKGGDVFENFFKESLGLRLFVGKNFYKNIRCGVLHQGETTGGWRIRRSGDLLNLGNNTINSVMFLEEVEKVLKSYVEKLESAEWDSEIWDNCRVKMRSIIKNCNSID